MTTQKTNTARIEALENGMSQILTLLQTMQADTQEKPKTAKKTKKDKAVGQHPYFPHCFRGGLPLQTESGAAACAQCPCGSRPVRVREKESFSCEAMQ